MRGCLLLLPLFVAQAVYAVPIIRGDSTGTDEIEQELIRHHHATSGNGNAKAGNTGVAQNENKDSDSSSEDSILDDASLYDFTVADVLADIIYELKKNPVLLEQLIESERQKVERRIEEMSLARQDSYGDDLSNFQKTAEQLQNEPKRVEKKAGRSGMAVKPDTQLENKRAQEVIDNNYAHSDASQETRDFQDFLNMPQEGGNTNALFGGQRQSDASSESEEVVNSSDDESDSADTNNSQGDSENTQSNGMTGYEVYQWMRHLPGFPPLRNYMGAPLAYQNGQVRAVPQTAGGAGNSNARSDMKEASLSSPGREQKGEGTAKLS